jgi:hypothetical protein
MSSNDFLGYVVWYSLPSNILVDLSELEPFREELDPLIRLPKKPSKINLFKRACKEVRWKDDGTKYFFGDEIKYSGGIYRYFIEEYKIDGVTIQDERGKATLTSDGHFLLESLSDSFPSIWEKASTDLKAKMQMENYVDHMAIRSVIKDALENKMKAVWLNSGTYFVKSDLEQLETLRKIVFKIGGELEIVPLVDTSRQRNMIVSGYSRLVNNTEKVFSEKLADLPEKPSAYKVQKLQEMIDYVKDIEAEVKQLGYEYSTSTYMKYMLETKLGET